LTRDEAGLWQLSVRDDGAGLDGARIREQLVAKNWYTKDQLDGLSDKQIMSNIFKPGFSTTSTAGPHAGRGVGLDVVQSNIQTMGARLMLSSVPKQHTEFKVRFTT
jgi:two-component system, chemotaxis family, sensor kinase CheA